MTRNHSTPALLPSPTEKRDPRAAAVQVPPFGDCCGATQFERADASGTNRQAMLGELVEVLSGGSQPLPSELKANAVRSRRDSAERRAPNCSGPAHGEHPVVNGKAGVLSAQGSTPPSSTNSPAPTLADERAARLSSSVPGRAAKVSQRRISRADTAPRLNAAMSQSLDARQDPIGQCQSRRSWGDVQPAKPSPIRSAAEGVS